MKNNASHGPETNPVLAGVVYALLAYLSWGLMPIYWKLVVAVPALQMVAHRVVWSVLVLVLLLSLFRRWPLLAATLRSWRRCLLLLLTAVLVSGNWLIFIWAVQHDQVLEASLGYFINPLLNVALGMIFLRERLRPWQSVAVLIAALGVSYQTWQLGELPWVSLALAFSFGIYGLLRKVATVDGLVGLSLETLLLLPFAAAYLIYVDNRGEGVFLRAGWQMDVLIVLAGLATALPLLWFANAARRLRYSTLGLFQYLAPSCQFLLAVAVYGEPFSRVHLVSFGCIWLALAIYTIDSSLALRRQAPPAVVFGARRP